MAHICCARRNVLDKNDEIIICDKKRMSAARFVGIHGDRAVSNSMKSYYDKPVPEIGKIYLINETNEIGEQGSPGRPERLICRPKQYSGYKGCFLLCEYFTAPDRPWHRSFLVEDFRK